MLIALSIFMFELALGGALFSFAQRRGSLRVGALVAVLIGLATVAAMSLLMNGWESIESFEKSLLLATGAGCGLAWSAVVGRCVTGRPGKQGLVRGAAVFFQLAVTFAAAWALSLYFDQKYPGWPQRVLMPRLGLFLSVGGALLFGGMLIHAAMLGLNELARWKEEGGDEGLLRVARLVCATASVRAAWIVCSIVMGAMLMPIGTRALITQMRSQTVLMIVVRVVLGLVLTFMNGLLVQASVREHRRRQAAIEFIPIALLVAFGELLGAGITVGLWGIAF